MIKIRAEELKKLILDALEQGLSNKGIAEYLNEQFKVPEEQKITTADVMFYKEKVGLKGFKPKKKKFFIIVEEGVVEEQQSPSPVTEDTPNVVAYPVEDIFTSSDYNIDHT